MLLLTVERLGPTPSVQRPDADATSRLLCPLSYTLLSHAIREGLLLDSTARSTPAAAAHRLCDDLMLQICTCPRCVASPPPRLDLAADETNHIALTFTETMLTPSGEFARRADFELALEGWQEQPPVVGPTLDLLMADDPGYWSDDMTSGRNYGLKLDMRESMPTGSEELVVTIRQNAVFGAVGGVMPGVRQRLLLTDEMPPTMRPLRAIHSVEYREKGNITDEDGQLVPISEYTLFIYFSEEVWGTAPGGLISKDDWALEVEDNLANVSCKILKSWLKPLPPPSPPPPPLPPPPPSPPCSRNSTDAACEPAHAASTIVSAPRRRLVETGAGTERIALDIVLSAPVVDGMALVYFMGPRVGRIHDRMGNDLTGYNTGGVPPAFQMSIPPFVPPNAQTPTVTGNTINPSSSGAMGFVGAAIALLILLAALGYFAYRYRLRERAKQKKKELKEKLAKLDGLHDTLQEALDNDYGPSAKACVLFDKVLAKSQDALVEDGKRLLLPVAADLVLKESRPPKEDETTLVKETTPTMPASKVALYDPITKKGMPTWQQTILRAAYLAHQERELASAKNDRDALEHLLVCLHEASTPLLQEGWEGGGGVRVTVPSLPPAEQIDRPRPPVARAMIDETALPRCVIEAAVTLGKENQNRESTTWITSAR